MNISMGNKYFSSDTGQDKTEWPSVWRITINFSSYTGQDKTE